MVFTIIILQPRLIFFYYLHYIKWQFNDTVLYYNT